MNVIVNGQTYENVSWNGEGFDFQTGMTLAEIESAFTPGVDTNIVVSEDDQEVARYYNKGITSMTVSGNNPRIVSVRFDLTQISGDAETEIRSLIEDSDGAIVELAEIVAAVSGFDIDGLRQELSEYHDTYETLLNRNYELMQMIKEVTDSGGILDQLDARITALEHPASSEEE